MQRTRDQIAKDLHRTFAQPAFTSESINALRRLLHAYASYNARIGYCQGMNFLAGWLLRLIPEEAAFWGLHVVCKDMLKHYFDETMHGTHPCCAAV